MHAVTCDDPPTQSLQDRVMIMDKESDIPIMEGQFITYTCPSGFILTGPNASECTRNREWEPDPGEVACIGNYFEFIGNNYHNRLYIIIIIIHVQLTVDYHLRTEISS